MAERNTKWQKIERTDKVQEYFWLGEFIQSDKWQRSAPPVFKKKTRQGDIEEINYQYLKDCFQYRGVTYTFDNEIHVTKMIHATKLEHVLSIIEDGGLKSKEKHYPGIGPMSLVWFGLKIGGKEIDCMKTNINSRMQLLIKNIPKLNSDSVDSVLSKIAHSPVFQPMSRYGHFKFTIGIKKVLQAYATQFCDGLPHPEMRKLGTFAYKQETQHVILVCPPNTPGTDNCPLLSDDPVIEPDKMHETWTWKPHSTGNQYISFLDSGYPWETFIRWEHVAFAFYVPMDRCLQIPDLESCVSLCVETSITGDISGVDKGINMMLDLITSMEANKKKSLADTLISMIAGYLKEERLYEKTMENDGEHVQVKLEPVLQHLRELLLPSEFEQLNWWPLTKWMNSLTRPYNVLHEIQKAGIRLGQ